MIRNMSIMKVVVVSKQKKKKKISIGIIFGLGKKQNPKLEVLSCWKEHYNQFPKFSLMARDLMSTGEKMHLN